jgi:capsular exopolysaccharide synthesis family protein
MDTNQEKQKSQTEMVLPKTSSRLEKPTVDFIDESISPKGFHISALLMHYLSSVIRYRALIIYVVLLFLMIGIVLVVNTKPIYQGSATIKFHPSVASTSSDRSDMSEDSSKKTRQDNSQFFLKSQVDILTNQMFLNSALEPLSAFDIDQLPVKQYADFKQYVIHLASFLKQLQTLLNISISKHQEPLMRMINFESVLDINAKPDQFAIAINAFSYDPELATRVVTLIAQHYGNLRLQRKQKEDQLIEGEVNAIARSINHDIEKKSNEIDAYQKKHHLASLIVHQTKLQNLEHELSKKNEEIKHLRTMKTRLREGNLNGIDDILGKLQNKKRELDSLYQKKNVDLKPKHPEMMSLENQINGIQADINLQSKKNINNIDTKINNLARQLLTIKQNANAQKQYIEQNRDHYRHLLLLKDELIQLENAYASTVQYHANIANIRDLNFPIVTYEVIPNPLMVLDKQEGWQMIYYFSLFGLGVALFLIGLLRLRGDTYRESSKIEETHKVPVIADIYTDSILSTKKLNMLAVQSNLQEIYDDYKNLARTIFYSSENGPPNVICCTSVVQEKNDWITAVGLAIAFAKQQHRVLLVDMHLKHPVIDDVFNINNEAGLTNILVTGDSPIHVTHQSFLHNLSIITTGPSPANASRLMAGEKMKTFIISAKEAFDMIIVNAPPIHPKSDVIALSKHVDATIITAFSGKTREYKLGSAIKKLNLAAIQPMGVVFNRPMPIGYKLWKKTQHQLNTSLKLLDVTSKDGN